MAGDPYKVDFASLRMLKQVYDLGSFSGAALALGVSQSVVSYTIDRLREVFDDPLFLRQGGGIVPTDRCVAAVEEAERLLVRYENLVAPPQVEPATLRQTFTLSCNFFERRWILPPVVRALRSRAPQVELTVIPASTIGEQQLARGTADLLIGPMRPEGDKFYCRTLLRETYVCIMDPAHPLAGAPLSIEDYAEARHVLISYGEGWTSHYLTELAAQGHALRNVAVTVPSPGGIEDLIAGTDLVATVPRRFALSLAPRLQVADCPFPTRFQVDLVWSARTHGSPVHRWFRDLLAESVAAI